MAWLAEQRALIGSLSGLEITAIGAVEWALLDAGADGLPLFRHEQLPFIQCNLVEFALRDGRFAIVTNYQDDDIFGLMVEMREATSLDPDWGRRERDSEPSLCRLAPSMTLKMGNVDRVECRLGRRGNLSEIELSIAGQTILLKAGEVREDLTVTAMDECVLLFADARDIERVRFNSEID